MSEPTTPTTPTTPEPAQSSVPWMQSTSTEKLDAAFIAAQREMGSATKDSKNPHFRSTYADLASVIRVVKPALNNNDLGFRQFTQFDTTTGVASVTTTVFHASSQFVAITCSAKPKKADIQGQGSVFTYLKRYSLQALCGLPSEDDDGNAGAGRTAAPSTPARNNSRQPAPPSTPAKPMTRQEFGIALKDRGVDSLETFQNWYAFETSGQDGTNFQFLPTFAHGAARQGKAGSPGTFSARRQTAFLNWLRGESINLAEALPFINSFTNNEG
jgi:hypothetical protein